MTVPFTYQSYANLIYDFLAAGYRMARFVDDETEEPTVLLRHDVDLSLDKAIEMAEMEHAIGVSSTYFVLMSSDVYSVTSREGRNAVRMILEHNHEIGLHFNVGVYDRPKEKDVLREIELLEGIIGEDIWSVSWHIPDIRLMGKRCEFLEERGIANAYDNHYFYDYRYCSDSNMFWKTDPYSYLKLRMPKIQMLTHPIWYWSEERKKQDIYRSLIENKEKVVRDAIDEVIRF